MIGVVLFLFIPLVFGSPTERSFDFTILHNNDIHGRFEEADVNSNICTRNLSLANACYGGFARTAHIIKKFRQDQNPVLYLNAGDTFTGTTWFQIFKEQISSEFLNYLRPDAATLGNHEFDFGTKTLKKFIEKLKFPVVISNLNLTNSPSMLEVPNLKKSLILKVSNLNIGIVGYVLPDTMNQSSTEDIIITDEIEAINKEAEILKGQNVNIIIALAHSGFEMDKLVATQCPEIDVIIGGHTNTFLYNRAPPSIEMPEDLYPVVVEQANGRKVLVVQAYAYTKYLGVINLKFDSHGEIVRWSGNPILLDYTIPEDKGVLNLLEKYRPNITALSVVIGKTNVFLNGTKSACRKSECNLGNVFTDAMLFYRKNQQAAKNEEQDVFISIIQTGGIKSSIDNTTNNGSILLADLVTVYPYKNMLYVANLKGVDIANTMERSASSYDAEENGGFLQFSGLKVLFKMSNLVGERVQKIEVRTADDFYEPLDSEKMYKVIMNKFILKGGDGYIWTDKRLLFNAEPMDITDFDAVLEYLKCYNEINPEIEGRQINI